MAEKETYTRIAVMQEEGQELVELLVGNKEENIRGAMCLRIIGRTKDFTSYAGYVVVNELLQHLQSLA